MQSDHPLRVYDAPPYRLSGVVYGPLLNHGAALAHLGAAAYKPPYQAPPKEPVLYMKPRNSLAFEGQQTVLPHDVDSFNIGATLGLVVGRTACAVSAESALDYVAGAILVADLTVDHDCFYRPSVRHVARDASCFIGPCIVPLVELGPLDALSLSVRVNGGEEVAVSLAGLVRPAGRLLADVTNFMTLSAGDILLLGAGVDQPRLQRGQRFVISAPTLGELQGAAQ